MLSACSRGTRALVAVWMMVCLSGSLVNAEAAEVDAGKVHPDFHIYLLIGQSNMAGRGAVDEESKTTHPRVLMLTKDLKWAPATDPLHFDKPMAGVGPGLAFGKMMADAMPNVKIGLVPCAMGGSRIEEWEQGAKNYVAMSARMREALKAGVLKGILWHQGESNIKTGSAYGAQLVSLINRLRKEFDAPDVPFIAAEITDFKGTGEPIRTFNATVHAVGKKVSNFACVQTQDLKHKGDRLHYNTESARELGKRYAKAMLGSLDKK